MSNSSKSASRSKVSRRFWKFFTAAGAGGSAFLWLEEMLLFAQEILALVFLPILAGTVYLLDIFIFKSRMPRREDLANSSYGENK